MNVEARGDRFSGGQGRHGADGVGEPILEVYRRLTDMRAFERVSTATARAWRE